MRAFWTILMLLASALALADGRSEQNIHADVLEDEISTWLGNGGYFRDAADIERVVDSLYARGYFAAQAHIEYGTPTIDSGALIVKAGQRYNVSAVRVLGDSALITPTEYMRLPLHQGVACEAWRIDEAAREILTLCESRGYPFAQVDIDSFEIKRDVAQVVVHLKLNGGPRIAIEFVEFSGNMISQPRLLHRESGLRIGEVYDQRRVKRARRRLAQLEYLRQVDEPQLVINDAGQSGLLFRVREARLSRLDVVAGLGPKVEGETQAVTGLADLQFLNLFGTGRRGKVFWQRPASGTQELALAWREVWVAGTPMHADLSFAQRVEDTLYVTRKYGARLGYPVAAETEVFSGIAQEELLADSQSAAALDFVPHQTILMEVGFVVDTRDHVTNPRSGVRFETLAARGRRSTDRSPTGSNKTEFEQRRAAVDVEANRELWLYWILHMAGHARILDSDEPSIPVSDLQRVGGARSIRGYREEQFLGNQVGWATTEARYWLGPVSRLAIFVDGGVITRKGSSGVSTSTLYRTSYGIGLRLETGVGVWGIDYGIATGDSPLNGQLHVSLLSLF